MRKRSLQSEVELHNSCYCTSYKKFRYSGSNGFRQCKYWYNPSAMCERKTQPEPSLSYSGCCATDNNIRSRCNNNGYCNSLCENSHSYYCDKSLFAQLHFQISLNFGYKFLLAADFPLGWFYSQCF